MAEQRSFAVELDVAEALMIASGYLNLDFTGATIYLLPVTCRRIGFDFYLVPVGEVTDGRRVVSVTEQEP